MQIQNVKVNEFCSVIFNGGIYQCRVVEHGSRKSMFSPPNMVKVKFVGSTTFEWISPTTEIKG